MAAFALVLRASLPDGSPVPVSPHPYTELRPPWVIAHRGGMGRWPENTLFAFERALAAGQMSASDVDLLCELYEQGLREYTYLSRDD